MDEQNLLKKVPIIMAVLFFIQMNFSFVLAQTEDHEVTGRITSLAETSGLPGVNVLVKGTANGTITDLDGYYKLIVPGANTSLVVSSIGYLSQEILVTSAQSVVDVVLVEDVKSLEEIVVVGYRTQEQSKLTAAISSIKNAEIQTTSATSLAQKLSGKISGLNIRQNAGQPGTFDNNINIRGFGEPIYVIDGIARGTSADFQRLNGQDIESITVLKDASAAIYGLNAANGVIIVTTKMGRSGKTKFSYTGTVGFSKPTDVPEMSNAGQFLDMRNDANLNVGKAAYISDDELALWQTGGPGYESTDWNKETFKSHSVRKEHNISAEGGNDKVTFYMNANIIEDGGILRSGDMNYKKVGFRSNISAKLTDNITARIAIATITDRVESPIGGIHNIWRGAVSSLPMNSVYANDNPDYLHRVQDGQSITPVALAQSDLTGYNRTVNNIFQTTSSLTYEAPFLKGLEVKGTVAYDPNFSRGKAVAKEHNLYDYDEVNDVYIPTAFNSPSWISEGNATSYLLDLQAQISYSTTLNDVHNIGATFVFDKRELKGSGTSIRKFYDFYTNDQIDQAGETNATSGGSEWEQRTMSYLGSVNYDYKGKYLAEVSARYDGSYRYHPDIRWGLFPVISAAWRVSEENFMQGVPILSNLKIRGSYGSIGQDTGEPFQFIPAFSTTGGGSYEFSEGIQTSGASTPAIVNPELTWTESVIKDVGIDIGFFDNKLSITADIYQRDKTGILAYRNVTIPNTFGGTLPQENLNSERTKGFDMSLSYKGNVGELSYAIRGNMNFARTMNVHVESAPYTSSWSKYRGGASDRWNDIQWMYNNIGQFQNEEDVLQSPIQNGGLGNGKELPGDYKYEDVNGDGVIDGNDIVPSVYNETPKTFFGLTLEASWKGFDFSALFQGAANYTVRYTHAYTTMFWGDGNLPAYFEDRWQREDPTSADSEWIAGKYPASRLTQDAGMMYAESDAWRKSASYLRFKNLEIGYTFNQDLIKKVGIQNVRIYTNLNNVFTLADAFVKPFDPESVKNGAFNVGTGWTYPLVRTFNIGLNVNF